MLGLTRTTYFKKSSRYQNSINILTSNLTVKKSSDSNLCKIGLTLEFASYLCSIFIFAGFLATYRMFNSPFYLVETDYKKWVSNLPSYTICPEVNSSFFLEKLEKITKIKNDTKLEFITGLLNPRDKYCHQCSNFSNMKSLRSPKIKYKKIVEEVSHLCEGILLNCFWNGKPFQCCRFFQKIPTDRGICFSINSFQTKDPENLPGDMITTYSQPNAILNVEASVPVRVYVHDKKELNFQLIYDMKPIKPKQEGKLLYKFEEVLEDETSWLLTLSQRNCVLSNEINLDNFKVYSESACQLQCVTKKQIEFCKCKHHFLPGPGNDCGLKGLQCLDKYKKRFEQFDDCGCLQDCSYTEVKYIEYSIKKCSKASAFAVIELAKHPTERIKLVARVTKLDIIVALACLSRLFTNATFDEMIFHLYWITKEFFLLTINYWKSFFSKIKTRVQSDKKT